MTCSLSWFFLPTRLISFTRQGKVQNVKENKTSDSSLGARFILGPVTPGTGEQRSRAQHACVHDQFITSNQAALIHKHLTKFRVVIVCLLSFVPTDISCKIFAQLDFTSLVRDGSRILVGR